VSAAAVALALGEERETGRGWRCRCPLCGCRTLAITEGAAGRVLVWCWAGCIAREIFLELHRRNLLDAQGEPETEDERAQRLLATERERQRKIAEALDLWGQTRSAQGTIIERYWHSRCLSIRIPPTIRLLGMHNYYGWHASGERRPQLVGLVGLVEHAEQGRIAVTCTYLAIDGSQKATVDPPRIFHGSPWGGAVRLAPARPDRWLIVGEGIESVASAMEIYRLPGWACLAAHGLRTLVVPREIRRIVIAADHDASGTGEAAARDAAERWLWEDRQVRLLLPAKVDSDFNDELRGTL
jgi:putative DNA primase/helicase